MVEAIYPIRPIKSTNFLPFSSLNLPQKGVKIRNIKAEKETKEVIDLTLKPSSLPISGIVCQYTDWPMLTKMIVGKSRAMISLFFFAELIYFFPCFLVYS